MAMTMNTSVVARPGVGASAARQSVQPRVASVARPLRQSSLSGTKLARRQVLAAKASSPRLTVSAAAAVEAAPKISEETLQKSINAIRFLAIDAVNKANSGHPGLPMGCAPLGYLIYNELMNHNPQNPKWYNRDRFILSAGHGSMLQYALLHLCGYPLQIDDLKQFRQLHSKTPGHPENFLTEGVEVTTGPLGMGICNAVGFAAAEKHMAARFNKPDFEIVDHYTYCIVGDGCNMEGISNEANSLAGHWGLGKLIAFYDDNKISIDGDTKISFTEDVSARYAALGWHVQHVKDGNTDLEGIRKAVEAAKAVTDKPSLIKVSTLIGYGSPNKAGSHDVHGAALGAAETEATRAHLKWDYAPFEVPGEVYDAFKACQVNGTAKEAEWNKLLEQYKSKYPEEAAEFTQLISDKLPEGWEKCLPSFTPADKGLATRLHSQTMLNAVAPALPGFIGGSADLAGSNMTLMKMYGDFQKETPTERNFRFGVREHGMGAICNGLALHSSGLIPYCATFFVFTDYMRSAIRMSAISEAGVIYVMTHDSIGLGEDGPTHQPIEHLASFRAMPNTLMMRPGDGNETAGAYWAAIENCKAMNPDGIKRPSVIAFSRQGMPNQEGSSAEKARKGGYVIYGSESETPDVIFIGTGSELCFAVDAAKALEKEGKKARAVSLMCWELFEEQSQQYRDSVLPPSCENRISIEAGSTFGWLKYVGHKGHMIGIDTFGASAPAPALYKEWGITVEAAVEAAKKMLA